MALDAENPRRIVYLWWNTLKKGSNRTEWEVMSPELAAAVFLGVLGLTGLARRRLPRARRRRGRAPAPSTSH